MELRKDWKLILQKAWSIRFMALSAVCASASVITSVLPTLVVMTTNKMILLAVLTLVSTFLGMWSRVVVQKEVDVR